MAKTSSRARHLVRVRHTNRWIETTRDGRKVASSSDLLQLPKVQKQLKELRERFSKERPDLAAPARSR